MLRKSLESVSTPPPKGFGSSKNKIKVKCTLEMNIKIIYVPLKL